MSLFCNEKEPIFSRKLYQHYLLKQLTMKIIRILSLLFAVFLVNQYTINAQSCSSGAYQWSDINAIFVAEGCTSCHGNQGGLNLNSYTNVIAGGNLGSCGYNSPVEFLLAKVDGTLTSGCGSPMPEGAPSGTPGISPANILAIESWISTGALENCPPASCTNNPSVQAGNISPVPLLSGGTGTLSFTYVENFLDYTDDENNPVRISLCLMNIAPVNGAASIGGSFASTFNWVYDPVGNCFLGTQNQDILGGSGGTITLDFALVNEIACPTNQMGFVVNIQPAPCMMAANNTTDDTEEVFTCVACTNTELVLSNDDVTCNGANDGTATATFSNGTAPFIYSWSNDSTTASISNLNPNTYTVTVTDIDGCTATGMVMIAEPTAVTITGTVTNASCNGGTDGSAMATAAGGTSPYTYEWSANANMQTTAIATGLSAGTYTITVTDANSCTATGTVTISEPAMLTIQTTIINVTCNGASDGMADAMVNGGTPLYNYSWSDGQSSKIATSLAAGVYTLTVTDAAECTVTASVTVTEPDSLAVTIEGTNISCSGSNNGTATATITGGTAPYLYSWSNGAMTSSITGLAPGTYSVTVSDNNECLSTASVDILDGSALAVSATATMASCSGVADGSVSTTVVGGQIPYTYTWNNGQTSATATGLGAGTYTVTVVDNTGCTGTASAIVNEPDELTVTLAASGDVCGAMGMATSTVTGGTTPYIYNWSNGQSNDTATGLTPGTYTITVSDTNECTTVESITISPTASLMITITLENVSCNGASDGNARATPAGGISPYTYVWTNGQTTNTATGLPAGNYTVTVTDVNGCSGTAIAEISEPTLFSAAAVSNELICFGTSAGNATATASGGITPYTYTWSANANGQVGMDVTGLSAGNYMVTVTDANSCLATAMVTVVESDSIEINVTINDLSCNGASDGTITVSASGGTPPLSYNWSNGATTPTITGLSAGTYTVTINDANECSNSISIEVTEPDVLQVAISGTDVTCSGGMDGTATLSVSGGIPGYTYAWSANANGQINATVTGLAAGSYIVTVSDANECTATATIVINDGAEIAISTSPTNVNCNGGSDGTATVSITGGQTPYTYNWSDGQINATATGLLVGNYNVTVTDANGCTNTGIAEIIEPTSIVVQIAGSNVSCFGASDGTATAFVNGGTSPYTYLWSDGQSTAVATGLTSGMYTLTVTDMNSCAATGSINILDGASLTLGLSSTEISCGSTSDGTATVGVTGGSDPYNYEWNDGQSTAIATGLMVGSYTVTVIDVDGCSATGSIMVNEDQTIVVVQITQTGVSCNGDADGTAQATVAGGIAPYSYDWSANANGQTTAMISNLTAGTYTLTVTDSKGCSGTGMVDVSSPDVLGIGLSDVDLSCGASTGGAAITAVTGGTSPYSYSWSNGASTSSITGLTAGTYAVTVTDDNGCTESGSVIIDAYSALQVSIVSTNITCFGNVDGSATVMALGGLAPYSYMWNNGAMTSIISGLSAGAYTVTVTDDTGCDGTAAVMITEPSKITTAIAVQDVSCGGVNDGTATVQAGNGTAPYTYQWDAAAGNQTTATATGLMTGTYTVSITDANGCLVLLSAIVNKVACSPCDEATNSPAGICGILATSPNDPIGTEDCDNGGIDNTTECANGGDPNDTSDDCQSAQTGGIDICLLINGDPTHPFASVDCDNGGVSNIEECNSGENPFDSSDDCQTALDEQLNICILIAYNQNHPLAALDCDNGGIDNFTECTNGGDPANPADDCEVAADTGVDICAIIASGSHPWTSLDCDNGGVSNGDECAVGGDPSDPADDNSCSTTVCEDAIADNTDICAVITADPTHPLATEDCDNGGIDNATECANNGDPLEASDDCSIAALPVVDICAILTGDPTNPLATVDCDNGGIDNATECANNTNPFEPSDDCQAAVSSGVNICMLINYDPNHPLAALDCDNGGIDNYTECLSGEDPLEPSDDCQTVIDEDIEICSIISTNGNHPLASLDCDNGGVDNGTECAHQTNTNEPSDDCNAAVLSALDVCALIDGDPNHPLANQDCDNGGISNLVECLNGASPIDPSDDCAVAITTGADICAVINLNPNHLFASQDCDNGGVSNYEECFNGGDPGDPRDDCMTAVIVETDICAVILQNPNSPLATADCDNGGVSNEDECAVNGNPLDPADDCGIAASNGQDVCLIIDGDSTHPIATLDCDNGGVDNFTECENGHDPTDASDDCQAAIDGELNICLLISYDNAHPLATLDCDNGGVDNYTECINGGDPADSADDCEMAVIAGTDICAILSADPNHPWATLDCDNGGINNQTECAIGTDPSVPSDDLYCPPTLCEDALDGIIDICIILDGNPTHPIGTLDCDDGGVDNVTECANGGNPIDASDECDVVIDNKLGLCAIINGDPNHPLAMLDCDNGGVLNIDECANGGNPADATDDCIIAINAGMNVCQLINYDPMHPLAMLDCDGGGILNYDECINGGDPSISSDDCAPVMDGDIDVCGLLDNEPTNPLGNVDCDGDGVTNATECNDGTDPTDHCSFNDTSITLPVTADQSDCPGLCPDLTPISTILPGNIAGVSFVGVAIQITELNGISTDGSAIIVRIPSDPRFVFTWDPTLTSVALTPVDNIDWVYNGNAGGIFHEFQYNGLTGSLPGGGISSFGFAGTYDPQSTDGQTTITATIFPFSGGECSIINNTDSERLVYFE